MITKVVVTSFICVGRLPEKASKAAELNLQCLELRAARTDTINVEENFVAKTVEVVTEVVKCLQ